MVVLQEKTFASLNQIFFSQLIAYFPRQMLFYFISVATFKKEFALMQKILCSPQELGLVIFKSWLYAYEPECGLWKKIGPLALLGKANLYAEMAGL